MLHVTQHGPEDAPPIVFLHGGGVGSMMWAPVVRHLPAFRSILVDMPAHGGSGNMPWVSIDDAARKSLAAVEPMIEGKAPHIVGLSLGGYVGLRVLSLRPTLFSSAVLSGVHAGGMKSPAVMKLLVALTAPIGGMPFFAKKVARLFVPDGQSTDALVAEMGTVSSSTRARVGFNAVDYEPPSDLGAIKTRALFVAGSNEHALIMSSLGVLADRVPNGSAAIAEGYGHGWAGQAPELFAQTIAATADNRPLPKGLNAVSC